MDDLQFKKAMELKKPVPINTLERNKMFELSQRARKITTKINKKYHNQNKIRKLFSKLLNKEIDNNFKLFPPFYTDCGINITVGKNVFINSSCHFQDQGKIVIKDNVLIGHNVTLATLNHGINPLHRNDVIPNEIIIDENVWIGSNSVVLPGVHIGKNSIVGAGSIVTKNVPDNTIVAGNPAKIIRCIS